MGQVPLNNWFTSKLVAEKKVNLIFLETRDSIMHYIEELRPTPTLAVNPCICESLVNIDKLKLFELDNEENKEELINIIKDVMTKELPF